MELKGKLQTLACNEIKVNPRQRQHFDEEKHASLLETIKQSGQLQPILVDKEFNLIAGERRLRCCRELGIDIKAFVLASTVDTENALLFEILENFQRDNFTPAEEFLAIRSFHEAMEAKHGKAARGRYAKKQNETVWSQQKTAEALGIKQPAVTAALRGAKAIDEIPELAQLGTRQEIQQKIKRANKYMDTLMELHSVEEPEKDFYPDLNAEDNFMKELLHYENEDLLTHTLTLPDNFFHAILLDPPWGINIDKTKLSTPGKTTSKKNIKGFTFDDSTEPAMLIYEFLAKESFRISTSKAQGFVFIGAEHLQKIKELFTQAGWLVYVKPLIWLKPTGQCNVPDMYPASRYEMCLFLRKKESKLFQTKTDVLDYGHVSSDKKIHINEKPVDLYKDLLERITIEGMNLFDPTAGSGASLQAGLELGLTCYGCELDPNIYNMSKLRLDKVLKEI